MHAQVLVDRTMRYHLWKKHPEGTVREFALTLKRSISWVQDWLTRFRTTDESPAILVDRSHARTDADLDSQTTSQEVMETILELRDHPPESLRRVPGPKAILYYLGQSERLAETILPQSTRTVWRILAAAGRIASQAWRHLERWDRPGPMDEWQMDFKDVVTVHPDPNGKRQHLVECLNVIDVGTDILTGARVRGDFTAVTVISELIAIMQECGMPLSLRFDRDTRFVGSAQQGDVPSALVRMLLCLGIQPIICRPHHPEENGVIERYHRTYGEECLAYDRPDTLEAAILVTAAHRHRYNDERPNQSVVCGHLPPCVAHPDVSPLRLLPAMVDPDAWLHPIDGLRYRRKVQADTSITIDNHRYDTRRHLVGTYVTVQVDAAQRALVIEHAGQEVRRVAIKGLYGTGPVSLEPFQALRCAEAETEHRRSRRDRRSGTKRTRGARWIDRVSQAVMPGPEPPSADGSTEAAPDSSATADPSDGLVTEPSDLAHPPF